MDEIYLGEHTTLLPGVRFEATNATYGAPQYLLDAGGVMCNRGRSPTANNNYLNVLPGMHLRLPAVQRYAAADFVFPHAGPSELQRSCPVRPTGHHGAHDLARQSGA